MQPDYYNILEISQSADLEEIKQATQTKANDIKTALSFALLSHAEAQARLKEIEEAFETLSKPEIRATYDSQWQPATSPLPHSPPIPLMDDVVVEQKPVPPPDRISPYRPPPLMQKNCLTCNAVIHRQAELCPHCGVRQSAPPPDRDKSQDSPYPSATVSPINDADRDTTEIELADRGTRLKAVIADVLIMLAPFSFVIFVWNFLDLKRFAVSNGLMAALSFIIIMTNLVLLYRHGQTLGKRLFSIKIVDTDGRRRVGLLRILLVRGLVIILPGIFFSGSFILFAISSRDLVLVMYAIESILSELILSDGYPLFLILRTLMFAISTGNWAVVPHEIKFALLDHFLIIVLVDALFIFQNSRRCLHDMIAKTIVVKVFPGKNDSPYWLLTGAIGAITLVVVVPFFLFVAAMIPANVDHLRRDKMAEAIELLGGLKTPAEEYMAAKGEFPPTIDPLTNKTSGKYTASIVSNPKEFYFEAFMRMEDTFLGGKSVRIIYHPDTRIWSCSGAYPNGIPPKYLPSTCQE